jgi:hypothetical protein
MPINCSNSYSFGSDINAVCVRFGKPEITLYIIGRDYDINPECSVFTCILGFPVNNPV